jgi:hypothetical protein
MSRRFDRIDPPRPVWTFGDVAVVAIVIALGLVLFFLVFILLATTLHAHDSWISTGAYRSPVTREFCCGDYDCKPLNYSPKEIRGGYLLENDEAVKESEVMRVSPEGWIVCRRPDGSRRCVFAPLPVF